MPPEDFTSTRISSSYRFAMGPALPGTPSLEAAFLSLRTYVREGIPNRTPPPEPCQAEPPTPAGEPNGYVADTAMAERSKAPTAEPFLPDRRTLSALREAAAGCRGCDLYRVATQTVFGEGRA